MGSQWETYTYTVTNTSPSGSPDGDEPGDDKPGDLLAAFKAANGGSDVLAYGASVTFSGDAATVAVGDAGRRYTQRGERPGQDDEGQPGQRQRHGDGDLHGRAASIDIAKSASPATVSEGGVGGAERDLHLHGHQHQPGHDRPGDGHQPGGRQGGEPAGGVQGGQRRQRRAGLRGLGDVLRDADPGGGRRGRQLHQRGERGGAGRRGQPDQRQRHGDGDATRTCGPDRHRQVGQPGDGQRGRGGRCRA